MKKGENPSKRPTWRQSEIDDTIRYRKAGYTVEPQVSFLDGQRCKNGTPGHEFGSMRRAVAESKDPNVEVIYMDKSLKHVTNGEVNSRMRPDVTVVTKDGRIATHEVLSKSQTKRQLDEKIKIMQRKIPEDRRGLGKGGKVFDVNGREVK